MNIEEAKKIPITDYLHSLGYSPVKQQGANLWYKSPLREEHEASFQNPTPFLNNNGMTSGLAKAATSSHWHRNFTVPTICRTS